MTSCERWNYMYLYSFFFLYSWAKRSFVLKVINLKFQAYENGYVMPNQYHPDLLSPPLSLSAHLRFGCLSVRKFYWSIHDKFEEVLLNVYELKEIIIELSKFWVFFFFGTVYLYNQNIFNRKYSFVLIHLILKQLWKMKVYSGQQHYKFDGT